MALKYKLAKLALKFFEGQYNSIIRELEVGTAKKQYIKTTIPEIVMKDGEWHNFSINFWAQEQKADVLIDIFGVWNKASDKEMSDTLYNAGKGLKYSELPKNVDSEKALISWFEN